MGHCETVCERCGARPEKPTACLCSDCGGLLTFRYSQEGVEWDQRYSRSMWRYRQLLPVSLPDHPMTLDEGGTPLLRSRLYPDRQVWLKDETRNPTGSHKDRALALGINHALSIGARASAVVSAGSTGLSHAAYAARAGLPSLTLMSAGAPEERAYPVFALGTTPIIVRAEIDVIIDALEKLGPELGVYVNSTTRRSNPYQSEAAKTIAYEIFEQLGRVPDWVVLPLGGGGTVSAIWRGFKDLEALGRSQKLPRLLGVVPERYNTIELAFREKVTTREAYDRLGLQVEVPTILSKLAHLLPPDGFDAVQAIRASGGSVKSISDDEALVGQERIARHEGLYVEPSSGTVIGPLEELVRSGTLALGEIAVVLLCGSGFRETFVTMKRRPWRAQETGLEALPQLLAGLLTRQ